MKKTALYQFGQIVISILFSLLYRYDVKGMEHIPKEGAALLCSNHTALKDPLFLGIMQKRQVWFMAKKELFQSKFMAWLLKGLGVFPVARSGGAAAIHRGVEVLNQGNIVGIFIEGTRSKTGEPLKPKPGVVLLAEETKAPIVPVAIVGPGGRPPKLFRKTRIRVGEAIPYEALGVEDHSTMEMRRISRMVMSRIVTLRDQAMQEEGAKKRQGKTTDGPDPQ